MMQIGIGLPNTVPGAPGRLLVDWAARAEARGFSALATIDRIAYPSYESLVTLAAAGAVTERVGLMTNILLSPTRSPILLAKEAASVDQLSGGRLTLGLGVGTRGGEPEGPARAARQDHCGSPGDWAGGLAGPPPPPPDQPRPRARRFEDAGV